MPAHVFELTVVGIVIKCYDTLAQREVAWKRMVKHTENMSREIQMLLLFSEGCNFKKSQGLASDIFKLNTIEEGSKPKSRVIQVLECFYSKNCRGQIIQNIILELGEMDLEQILQQWKS